jgi:hypothetical protein
MAEVFICPKGAIALKSIKALSAAGIIVVEADEPERCQFIRSTEVVSADDMLWAALGALNHAPNGYGSDGSAQRQRLAKLLFDLVDTKHTRMLKPYIATDPPVPPLTPQDQE